MKTRLRISVEAELGDDIRAAARKRGVSVSVWMAEAVSARLRSEAVNAHARSEALREFLDEWERENGRITEEELRRAEIELGVRRPDSTTSDRHEPPTT